MRGRTDAAAAPAIGGFFELELPAGGAERHDAPVFLTNARACIRLLLAATRPRLVHVPFYTCNALLEPLQAEGIPYRFYPIDRRLRPILDWEAIGEGELPIVVNYFGLLTDDIRAMVRRSARPVLVDNTQAFFEPPIPGAWCVNSARKWFGVPDGAYMAGPMRLDVPPVAPAEAGYDYLVMRWLGDQAAAFAQYQASERRSTSEVRGASPLSRHLLRLIDYDEVARRRRANFVRMHARLAPLNVLEAHLDLAPDAVPYYYPFLPARRIERATLHADRIYFPKYWQDCQDRPTDGLGHDFAWEKHLTDRLLPLPIDHRYGPDAADRVLGRLMPLLEEAP